MRFCDDCGSYLRETEEGLWCSKCKRIIRSKPRAEVRGVKKTDYGAIYVIDKAQSNYAKVSQACPKCGNEEAFHWFSSISGEHAGIRRERTVEHFKCISCSYTWSRSF